ncbi:hypothetical protein [Rhodoferax sp. U11-2br]|uniref:hypothetical protein n=1 Tax=Rhodoferax sp. U11-2br TaxID=2838878 RepID=UPI001BEBFC89|nr:hypothetical protein [Rhodoferax sp. U11-2br]MBT3066725.1 hypothetical protein [Rhodoferax sp. U11-2br]
MLGLDFAKIERLINPDCAAPRDDKGGYRQPQLWRKYGRGDVSPFGNGHGDSKRPTAVVVAEQYAPGSSDIFHSPLWRILKTRQLTKTEAKKICEKLADPVALYLRQRFPNARSLWFAVLKMDVDALKDLSCICHVDALAVLLLYRKYISWYAEMLSANYVEQWFQMMVQSDQAFAVVASRLKPLLMNHDARLFRPKLEIQLGGSLPVKTRPRMTRAWTTYLGVLAISSSCSSIGVEFDLRE